MHSRIAFTLSQFQQLKLPDLCVVCMAPATEHRHYAARWEKAGMTGPTHWSASGYLPAKGVPYCAAHARAEDLRAAERRPQRPRTDRRKGARSSVLIAPVVGLVVLGLVGIGAGLCMVIAAMAGAPGVWGITGVALVAVPTVALTIMVLTSERRFQNRFHAAHPEFAGLDGLSMDVLGLSFRVGETRLRGGTVVLETVIGVFANPEYAALFQKRAG
jgi:hypothetical protein